VNIEYSYSWVYYTYIIRVNTCVYSAEVIALWSPFTGWRRCIRCLKLQVFFRKRAIIHRAPLRKMTYKDKASYASLPPFMSSSSTVRLYIHMYVCDEDPLSPPFLQCVYTYIHICNTYVYVCVQCIRICVCTVHCMMKISSALPFPIVFIYTHVCTHTTYLYVYVQQCIVLQCAYIYIYM